jgi:hypothetical protein
MANHVDPKAGGTTEAQASPANEDNFEAFAGAYKDIHENHKDVMYFVVSVVV